MLYEVSFVALIEGVFNFMYSYGRICGSSLEQPVNQTPCFPLQRYAMADQTVVDQHVSGTYIEAVK